VFPSTSDSDWSAVNLYNMAGANTWPIVLVSYFYVKKDQSATNAGTASALKGFIKMILNNYDQLCEANGFTPPSTTLKSQALSTLGSIAWPSGLTEMRFETDILADGTGMMADVISAKRYAYDDYARDLLKTSMSTLDGKVSSLSAEKPQAASDSKSSSSGNSEALAIASIAIAVVAVLISTFATCRAFQASKSDGGGGGGHGTSNQQEMAETFGSVLVLGVKPEVPQPAEPDEKASKGGKGDDGYGSGNEQL